MLETGKEMTGTLEPNGSIVLDEKPALPPGRVRVTLTPMPAVRLPNEPILDDCIPAPFDLPREGPVTKVKVRQVQERLPQQLEYLQDEPG